MLGAKLKLSNISVEVSGQQSPRHLLRDISAEFPSSHFGAIIGPSGCGKTTLLKYIAGIAPGQESGSIEWNSRKLSEIDFHSSEVSYVPQFSIAHEDLTARECVRYSLNLRSRRSGEKKDENIVAELLDDVGMIEFADRKVNTLSGGQRRRLALAMELTSHPEILLCDEVTSGLDPQSENEIVSLLKYQARNGQRLVLWVTHSLAHLETYDSVMVLVQGELAFHGSPQHIAHYFGIRNVADLYASLATRLPEEWGRLWLEYRDQYCFIEEPSTAAPQIDGTNDHVRREIPGILSQTLTLLRRRFLIFSRNTAQMFLQLGIILGFPLIVTIFAWNGLPAIKNLRQGLSANVLGSFEDAQSFLEHSSEVGSVVSGIVMFQVILLTLMGANNSGREIAAERSIFEKEKLAGLSPTAYLASKVVYLTLFAVIQSVWMATFVRAICQFPGDFAMQLTFLLMVNLALTAICLGISSLMSSAEQASLVSIYLVGFQLPLSGAVLAMPDSIGIFIRPLISAYWGWSGLIETLREERYYDIVRTVVQSPLAPIPICLWVLGSHIIAGITIAWLGCLRRPIL